VARRGVRALCDQAGRWYCRARRRGMMARLRHMRYHQRRGMNGRGSGWDVRGGTVAHEGDDLISRTNPERMGEGRMGLEKRVTGENRHELVVVMGRASGTAWLVPEPQDTHVRPRGHRHLQDRESQRDSDSCFSSCMSLEFQIACTIIPSMCPTPRASPHPPIEPTTHRLAGSCVAQPQAAAGQRGAGPRPDLSHHPLGAPR
jgi:hypothetical protein